MSDDQRPVPEPIEPPEDYEFVDPPEDEGPARGESGADARGWGPGWPANNAAKMATVRAGGIALSVRREVVPLVEWLVNETGRLGYTVRDGQCWGFANRPIRGTKRPSNHSWGLAVDLNSLANPMGDRLVSDMPGSMIELWKSKMFRWGGDYSGRKDAMHYEFMGTPADAGALCKQVGQPSPPQPPTPPPTPPPPPTGPLLRVGAKGADVQRLQQRLNAAGVACAVDGDFGPGTERAVKAFQQAHGLGADGVVGPRTWSALG